jgi:hypothetical protein
MNGQLFIYLHIDELMMHSDYHSGLKISQTDGRLYFHVMFSLLNTFGDIDPHVFFLQGSDAQTLGSGRKLPQLLPRSQLHSPQQAASLTEMMINNGILG